MATRGHIQGGGATIRELTACVSIAIASFVDRQREFGEPELLGTEA